MADVASDLKNWSTTAASNAPTDSTTIGAGLADNFQEVQKVVRQDLAHKGADIASAGTTDLGAVVGLMHDITGTTTITSFGTVSAGIWKIVKFEGALTLTHNATSLILLTGANRTTVAGDVGIYMSEGSGNWRELSFMPVNVQLTNSGVKFPATQAASSDANTLDDYEEGTWTMTISFAVAGNLSVAYTTQVGNYTKIGRHVELVGHIETSTFTHTTASGNLQVSTLPFTPSNTASFLWPGAVGWQGITKANYAQLNFQPTPGGSSAIVTASGSAQALANLAAADMPTGGTVVLRINSSYFT